MVSNHVLVVDDDPGIRGMVKLALRSEGYEVATAANGAEALAAIDRRPPAAMLLDIRMPVLDGRQVARRLREQGRWVPTVVMTAEEAAEQECREIGADGCLPKPFSLDDLYEVLESVRRR